MLLDKFRKAFPGQAADLAALSDDEDLTGLSDLNGRLTAALDEVLAVESL